jgi:6-phosphogluconolactonase
LANLSPVEEKRFPDQTAFAAALAGFIARRLHEGLSERGQASLVLSGGRTPRLVLPRLAALPLPWDKITVTLSDERWVPLDHPDSNEGMIREYLPAAAHVIGLYTGHATPEEGEEECEHRLANFPWPTDVFFLGMGEDGHTASLFPGFSVPPGKGRCLAIAPRNGAAQPRMTLTPQALLEGRATSLAISGKSKWPIYEAALQPGPIEDLPIRLCLQQERMPIMAFLCP